MTFDEYIKHTQNQFEKNKKLIKETEEWLARTSDNTIEKEHPELAFVFKR